MAGRRFDVSGFCVRFLERRTTTRHITSLCNQVHSHGLSGLSGFYRRREPRQFQTWQELAFSADSADLIGLA
jgi:hypothetical protein